MAEITIGGAGVFGTTQTEAGEEAAGPIFNIGEEEDTGPDLWESQTLGDNSYIKAFAECAQKSLDILNAKEGDKLCEYRMGLTENLSPCGFSARGVWWRGIADLVIVNVDEELAWVVDYKTGKSSRYADKGQLELMALALFKHFPFVKKVRAGLLFVVCEDFIKDTYTNDQEDILWAKWVEDIESMETAFRTEVWNPKPSGLCKRHCPVIECPHNGSY